jgi:apolipoprotein D and lipocalin family protein
MEIQERKFDMEKYQGRWYEIARYPFLYEINYNKIHADYTYEPDSNMFKIKNTALIDDKLYIEEGLIWNRQADMNTGRFRIMYYEPAGKQRDYIVIETDYNNYALIGDLSKTHFCILSRTPRISKRDLNMLLTKALEYGYDLKFIEIDYNVIC